MGRKKKESSWRKKKYTTLVLLVLAVGLLAFGAVGTTRAALNYISDYYTAQIGMYDIGVTLVENGTDIGWRNYGSNSQWETSSGTLTGQMLADGEKLQPGKPYKEELSVKNSGNIDEYVRVVIRRYWTDADGKRTDLSPDLIRLNVPEGNGWALDPNVDTDGERMVLYYTDVLSAGDTSPLFADKLTIDSAIANQVNVTETKDGNRTIIEAVYEYDGYEFQLEAEVDAVQTHSAAEAIKSAWGVDVAVDADGKIRLE